MFMYMYVVLWLMLYIEHALNVHRRHLHMILHIDVYIQIYIDSTNISMCIINNLFAYIAGLWRTSMCACILLHIQMHLRSTRVCVCQHINIYQLSCQLAGFTHLLPICTHANLNIYKCIQYAIHVCVYVCICMCNKCEFICFVYLMRVCIYLSALQFLIINVTRSFEDSAATQPQR